MSAEQMCEFDSAHGKATCFVYLHPFNEMPFSGMTYSCDACEKKLALVGFQHRGRFSLDEQNDPFYRILSVSEVEEIVGKRRTWIDKQEKLGLFPNRLWLRNSGSIKVIGWHSQEIWDHLGYDCSSRERDYSKDDHIYLLDIYDLVGLPSTVVLQEAKHGKFPTVHFDKDNKRYFLIEDVRKWADSRERAKIGGDRKRICP